MTNFGIHPFISGDQARNVLIYQIHARQIKVFISKHISSTVWTNRNPISVTFWIRIITIQLVKAPIVHSVHKILKPLHIYAMAHTALMLQLPIPCVESS